MRKSTRQRRHAGSRSEPLTTAEFGEWFDSITGPDGRALRTFPDSLDSVRASWQDAKGDAHHADSWAELEKAYDDELTASIYVTTSGSTIPEIKATYHPGGARPRSVFDVRGPASDVERMIAASKSLFPDPWQGHLVFLSWGGSESKAVATEMYKILAHRFPDDRVFFSERIDVGENPFDSMLDEGVMVATALVVILTKSSASNAFTIWETAAAWARGAKVIPVFVDVDPHEVPGPLVQLRQGVRLADREGLDRALDVLSRHLDRPWLTPLTEEEFSALSTAAVSSA